MQKITIERKGFTWIRASNVKCPFCKKRGYHSLHAERVSSNTDNYPNKDVVTCYCKNCGGSHKITRGLLKNKIELLCPQDKWLIESSKACPYCSSKATQWFDSRMIHNGSIKEVDMYCRECGCQWSVTERM